MEIIDATDKIQARKLIQYESFQYIQKMLGNLKDLIKTSCKSL